MNLTYIKGIIAIGLIATMAVGCRKEVIDSTTFGTAEVAGGGTSLAKFVIVNNTLFAVSDHALHTFDISNPANITKKADIPVDAEVETIYREGEFLYLGTTTGARIRKVNEMGESEEVTTLVHVRSYDPVVANSKYAFVTLRSLSNGEGTNALFSYDLTTIMQRGNINLLQEVAMDAPVGLGVDGDRLFVCDQGLKVFDVSDGGNMKQVDKFNNLMTDVILGKDGFLVGSGVTGVTTYKYSPGKLQKLGSLPIEPYK
ncbi:MAG: hypothetical protein SGJ04_10200 [Bacteroidota bacterium]|nr:hypothetical protein [Bacteroidota bacterium]